MGAVITETKFNAGIATLERIDQLLKECSQNCIMSRVPRPNVDMLNLWEANVYELYKEIIVKFNDKEKEKQVNKQFQKAREAGPMYIVHKDPNGNYNVINPKVFLIKYRIFNKIEIYLRKIADKRGMLLPNKPGAHDAIADMD